MSTVTPDDLAAVDRILDHDYADVERQMMAEGVASNRVVIARIRATDIDPNTDPALGFDPRLPGRRYPAPGPSSFTLSTEPLRPYDGDARSLAFASACDLSRLIQARKVTSLELTEMYLARLKEIGPRLNCVVTLCEDLALAQARRADEELAAGKSRGPLHGIPWGAKDLLATKGIPTTWGVEVFKGRVFDYDATVVRRLEQAGAVLLAKLSLGELAMGDVWFNGRTLNPWNPKTGSNGSSAGPAAATCAGLVGFSIGSETMGSIVSPCMQTGVTGLRPTYGRVSRYGAMPLARSLDKIGPMTRTVEDCALVLSAIHGPDGLDPTCSNVPFNWNPSDLSALKSRVGDLRVGIHQAAFDELADSKNEDRKRVYAEAIGVVRSLVGELRPVVLPPTARYAGIASIFTACETSSNMSELLTSGDVRKLKQQDEGAWPNFFRIGSMIPAADYLRALRLRTELQRDLDTVMSEVDCFVTIPYAGPTVAYTNLTGHPTLVTRAGMLSPTVPLTIEFVGGLYREDAILSLGLAFGCATSHHRLWPDTSVIPPLG